MENQDSLPKHTAGIKLGGNVSQTLINNFELENPAKPLMNFTGGIVLQSNKQNSFLRGGLVFQQVGFKSTTYNNNPDSTVLNGPYRLRIKSSYLSLPISYNLQTSGKVSFYVGGGIYASYLLRSSILEPNYHTTEYHLPYWEWEFVGYKRRNITNSFRRLDFGLLAQTGIKVPLKNNMHLDLGLGLSHGAMSVLRAFGENGTRYFNRQLGITANLQYPL